MMKNFLNSIVFFLMTNLICAQSISDSIINQQIEANYRAAQQYLYKDIDSTRYYLLQCYRLSSKVNDLNAKLGIVSQLINSDGYHYDLKLLNRDINMMDSIMQNDPALDTLTYKLAYQNFLISNKGNYYYKLNNLAKAKSYFQDLLDSLSKSNNELSSYDKDMRIGTMEFLAVIAKKEYKFDLANQFYSQILNELKNSSFENKDKQIASVNVKLSQVLINQNKVKEAKDLQVKSLKFLKTLSNSPGINNSLKSTYLTLIQNLIGQDSLDQALFYITESSKLYTKNDPFQKKLDIITGDLYVKKGQYGKAGNSYNKALQATIRYRDGNKHQDVAQVYTKLGQLFSQQGNFQESLRYYQKAIVQLSPGDKVNGTDKNPKPEYVSSKLEFVRILREKLSVLQKIYRQQKDTSYLEIALQNSYDLVKTLDVLKPEFESKVDREFLISETYPAFHQMVEMVHELYRVSKDNKYIEAAFYFMEKSKSILLLEATRNAQATSYGGVPEIIIDQEQQYRANIIYLEKKLFNQKQDSNISDSLFHLKKKYYDFIDEIEKNYPKYYDLKYNANVYTISEITSLIEDKRALLEFFLTGNELFVIVLEGRDAQFYKIPFGKDLQDTCKRYYKLISVLNTEDLNQIYALGNQIYKNILQKALMQVHTNKLIIVPDGVLNYIPIESLSSDNNTPHYLIEDYQISYANSATVLGTQINRKDNRKNRLLAYAPEFGNASDNLVFSRSDLGALIFNAAEARAISGYFKGKAVIGNDASLQSFKKEFYKYNMLHFATHAAANDNFPDYSYLAFSSEDNKNPSLLYVKDLYAYDLDADMVTLSACQTGLGKLQKGEGMLSLARGFAYAGARSLVTTLWKINDQTTAGLMMDFYDGLSHSLSKDGALREAKLHYLKGADDEFIKHPYYWSGFMITGDTAPLDYPISQWWWLLLILVPVLFLIYIKVKKTSGLGL